jgi:hypothetical protein
MWLDSSSCKASGLELKRLSLQRLELLQKSNGSLRGHRSLQMALQAAMLERPSLLYYYGLSLGLAHAFCSCGAGIEVRFTHGCQACTVKKKRGPALQRSGRVNERCPPHRRQPRGPMGGPGAHGEIRWMLEQFKCSSAPGAIRWMLEQLEPWPSHRRSRPVAATLRAPQIVHPANKLPSAPRRPTSYGATASSGVGLRTYVF